MKRIRSLILVVAAVAVPTWGQSQKDMTLALQRDVASLEETIKTMKASQDEKLAIINENLRNTLTVVTSINEKMAVMQTNMQEKLAEITRQVGAPTAALGQKVDAMNDQFLNLSNTIAELNSRIGKLDAKLDDVKKMVQTIPPAAAPAVPPPTQASNAPVSGEKLFEDANRDYVGGNYDLAMQGFNEYLKGFAGTQRAADAQFYIGEIYARRKEFDSAVKSYDAVIASYPDSGRVANAHYMRGVALAGLERNAAAGKEFRFVIAKYPATELARKSHEYLKALGLPVNTTAAKKRTPSQSAR